MLDLASLALLALISRRELRFDPVPEQESPEGCGQALVSALLSGGPVPARLEEGGALSLADLAGLATEGGLRVYPRRLDVEGLDSALHMGFAPIVLHYARPDPHWALLLGMGRGGYELADPARGLELVDRDDLAWRFSGAAMLIDPSTLDPKLSLRFAEAGARAEEGFAFLAAGRARSESRSETSLGLGGSLRFFESAAGPGFAGRIETGFDYGPWALSLDLGLGAALRLGSWYLVPLLSVEKNLAWERRFARLALSLGDDVPAAPAVGVSEPILAAKAGFGLMLDPLLFFLDLFAGFSARQTADVWTGLSLSAVEAVSERSSLSLACSLAANRSWSAPRAALSLRIAFRTASYGAGFAWMDSGEERGIVMEGEVRSSGTR